MNFPSKIIHVMMLLICIPMISSSAGAAEENPLDSITANTDNADRCVNLKLIDHTHIIEDSFILFYMRNKKTYLNVLPNRCPGLKNADTFMYRTSINRLCNVDVITVLYQSGGGFFPGTSCGLGLFYPIDKETAKQLEKRDK